MSERYELAQLRIEEINKCPEAEGALAEYFKAVTTFLIMVMETYALVRDGRMRESTEASKAVWNKRLYEELLNRYEGSFLNPQYAVNELGEYGQVLSAVYAECRSMIAFAYEMKEEKLLMRMELFLEIYSMFSMAYASKEKVDTQALNRIYASFAYDYIADNTEDSILELIDTDNGIAGRIIAGADLSATEYLYDYGEYISENELKMVRFLATLSDEEIDRMARTYTEGYRIGFITTGKDLSIKETVEIRYFIGIERVVRRAVELFDELGLRTSIRRAPASFVCGRRLSKIGYFGAIANKQFECDHENDRVLYIDRKYTERKLEALKNVYEKHKQQAAVFGGPAVIESFGEEPFCLVEKAEVLKPDAATRELITEYTVRSGDIVNQYIKGEERSFTIIAFPTPEIGDRFEEIFAETMQVNTLDYMLYRDMQQIIIDTLDKAKYVKIEGTNGNLTDLKVKLWEIDNPDKETIFENCVADVNIPVGEVFTSPVLEGTTGVLNVKNVYLNGMPYNNLKLTLKDGMIDDYSCENYDNEAVNKEYIKEHLLFQHKTLPIGEFAIGTNTTAYVMTKKYGLEAIMPILIAEKTGPHFAMGDTCYSHEEDMMTYNPDGKAIVARENSISALRKSDPLKAYFGCHTDITIPYDELGRLYGVMDDGTELEIIREGRFVLKGTEALNEPLNNA
ncbi:MAG: aminopeptidase [Lachnospiraceae bacterium]|nr:aminopeptidase [Candidatus Colinaster scatohippi]